jgi:L-alanine-DL-glutamate epimerase-like enolase superfamily enzyme
MALRDLAGKAAGLPVDKPLGGEVRDRVRVSNGSVRLMTGYDPADFAGMKPPPEGVTMVK